MQLMLLGMMGKIDKQCVVPRSHVETRWLIRFGERTTLEDWKSWQGLLPDALSTAPEAWWCTTPAAPTVTKGVPLVEGVHVRVAASAVGAGDGMWTLCHIPAQSGGLQLTQYRGQPLQGRVHELFPAGHTSGYVLQVRGDRGAGGIYVDGEGSSIGPPRSSMPRKALGS